VHEANTVRAFLLLLFALEVTDKEVKADDDNRACANPVNERDVAGCLVEVEPPCTAPEQ
jgi:hypothetical protein